MFTRVGPAAEAGYPASNPALRCVEYAHAALLLLCKLAELGRGEIRRGPLRTHPGRGLVVQVDLSLRVKRVGRVLSFSDGQIQSQPCGHSPPWSPRRGGGARAFRYVVPYALVEGRGKLGEDEVAVTRCAGVPASRSPSVEGFL